MHIAQFLSPIQIKQNFLSIISEAASNLTARSRWFSSLSLRQWLVLFTMGVVVIAIEVHNHSVMWRDHHSGQNFWTDRDLVWETIIFGLIIPILGGVMLGYLQRAAIDRDKAVRELALHRDIVTKIFAAKSWPELVELIVRTPDTIALAIHVWMLAQRSDQEKFSKIAFWEGSGGAELPYSLQVDPAVCNHCEKTAALNRNRILTCQHINPKTNNFPYKRYCLWLSSVGMGKSALIFDIPIDHPLNPSQLKMLDNLGGEMSLAIDNHNLQFLKQNQDELVKNERIKIAHDLHDTLGQNISYLRLKLEQLNAAGMTSNNTAFQDDLAKMLTVADVAYGQMRDTLDELLKLEQMGLEEAANFYAGQAAERAGFALTVDSSGQVGTLSARENRQIIFILREALNNIEKHAFAQNVAIHLQWDEETFILNLCDNGRGFQVDNRDGIGQYGLAIMEERSQAINANLTIKSTIGLGTELILSLPRLNNVHTLPFMQ